MCRQNISKKHKSKDFEVASYCTDKILAKLPQKIPKNPLKDIHAWIQLIHGKKRLLNNQDLLQHQASSFTLMTLYLPIG